MGLDKSTQQQATFETQKQAQKESQQNVQKEVQQERERLDLVSEGQLQPLNQRAWGYRHYVYEFFLWEEFSEEFSVKVYSLDEYMSSKKPPFKFDENLYVSENFAKTYEGQKPHFDHYTKNVHFTLNRYDRHKNIVKMMIISVEEAEELKKTLFGERAHSEAYNIWIESPLGDVYCGNQYKPANLPDSYYDQVQQVNYLAGNSGYIYNNLDNTSWLKKDTAKKMAFYKEHIAPLRDDRPQAVEALTHKLLSTSSAADPVIFNKPKDKDSEKKEEFDRKQEVESEEIPRNSPPDRAITYQFNRTQTETPLTGSLSTDKPPGTTPRLTGGGEDEGEA